MATPNETNPGIRMPGRRRVLRITALGVIVAAILLLAVISWLGGR